MMDFLKVKTAFPVVEHTDSTKSNVEAIRKMALINKDTLKNPSENEFHSATGRKAVLKCSTIYTHHSSFLRH